MSTPDSTLIATLTRITNDLLGKEIIDGTSVLEALEFVDLDIEDSPVLCHPGEKLGDEVPVLGRTRSGDYIVDSRIQGLSIVDPEGLKVMRARYLLTLKAEQRRRCAPLLNRMRGAS